VEILALFRALSDSGNTLIVVTHDATVASEARRMVKLVDGKVAEDRAT
jgi:putative ABC transport system ATP-binding protein